MEPEDSSPIELRQPSWALLFPVCALALGLAFALFGGVLGLSGTPAWVRGSMIVGPILLGALGAAYVGTFQVRADAAGITQTSLFQRRVVAWRDICRYAQGLNSDGSGWNQGDAVLTLQNGAGEPLMSLSLSLEPAAARERLVERIARHCTGSTP